MWIHSNSPDWLYEPMLVITALGYYWIVLPLLGLTAYVFYRKGARISAALLLISTIGGIALTTALKNLFQRARPELFDSGYTVSFYSFPSRHATIAVGFYGTLALLVAWHLDGFWRWMVVVSGLVLVLLIGSRVSTLVSTTRRTYSPASWRHPSSLGERRRALLLPLARGTPALWWKTLIRELLVGLSTL